MVKNSNELAFEGITDEGCCLRGKFVVYTLVNVHLSYGKKINYKNKSVCHGWPNLNSSSMYNYK